MTALDRDHWIAKRAYYLWEEAGRPEGKSEEHWAKAAAERDALEQTKASSDGAEVIRFSERKRAKAGLPATNVMSA
jgi:hypothetical protein